MGFNFASLLKRFSSSHVQKDRPAEKDNNAVLLIQLAFLIGLSLWYMLSGVFITVEILLGFVLLLLIWRAQQRVLLRDLLPFFVLFVSFQALRGFADNLGISEIHITDLIAYEEALFAGTIPAYYLQTHLVLLPFWIATLIGVLSSVFYMSHFITPVITAVVIWYRHKPRYWYFLAGLSIITYLAFITYMLYPAAPPWWATKYGYLPDQPITLQVFTFPTFIELAGPNPVAAMPSLHMAYPTYIAAFCIWTWRKKGLWTLFLPLAVGFSAVYLGHHYVIDLIAGAGLSLLVVGGLVMWKRLREDRKNKPTRTIFTA